MLETNELSQEEEDNQSVLDIEELSPELDQTTAEFVDTLVKRILLFTEEFCDIEFFPYQIPIAYRLIESIILGDGDELTVIGCRQSGKSEVLSNVMASMMVILPKLAPVYPTWLDKFEKGFWCGVFAPTEDQADTVFSRIVTNSQVITLLTSFLTQRLMIKQPLVEHVVKAK